MLTLLDNRKHMAFCNRLNLGLSECRKINDLGGLYPPRKINVVLI